MDDAQTNIVLQKWAEVGENAIKLEINGLGPWPWPCRDLDLLTFGIIASTSCPFKAAELFFRNWIATVLLKPHVDLSVCCVGLCVFSPSGLSVCLFVYPVSHLSLTARILLEETLTLHEAVGSVCVCPFVRPSLFVKSIGAELTWWSMVLLLCR